MQDSSYTQIGSTMKDSTVAIETTKGGAAISGKDQRFKSIREQDNRDDTTPIVSPEKLQAVRETSGCDLDCHNKPSVEELLMDSLPMLQAEMLEDDILADLQDVVDRLSTTLPPLSEELLANKIQHLEKTLILLTKEVNQNHQDSMERTKYLEERINAVSSTTTVQPNTQPAKHNNMFKTIWKVTSRAILYVMVRLPLEIAKTIILWFVSMSLWMVIISYFLSPPDVPRIESNPGIM